MWARHEADRDARFASQVASLLLEDAPYAVELKSGGLGMRLINTVMDEVHYAVIPGQKNELRMIKRLKK